MSNETALVQMKQWEREHSLWEEHLWGYPVWSLDRFRWHRMEAFRDEQETPIVSSQPRGWERFGAERFVVAQSMRDLRRGGPGACRT